MTNKMRVSGAGSRIWESSVFISYLNPHSREVTPEVIARSQPTRIISAHRLPNGEVGAWLSAAGCHGFLTWDEMKATPLSSAFIERSDWATAMDFANRHQRKKAA